MAPQPPKTKKDRMTARDKALQALRANPDGLSKSRLREAVGGNPGAFRRLIQSMEDKGEITVVEENNPNWGPTKIVRAVDHAPAA